MGPSAVTDSGGSDDNRPESRLRRNDFSADNESRGFNECADGFAP